MEQAQIVIGADVITANGQSVGKVIAVRPQDFIVEGGIFIKYMCSYQVSDVVSATANRVELSLDSQAIEQPWNVTQWTDDQGNGHHIRQVGVPMTATTPPIDTSATQNQQVL